MYRRSSHRVNLLWSSSSAWIQDICFVLHIHTNSKLNTWITRFLLPIQVLNTIHFSVSDPDHLHTDPKPDPTKIKIRIQILYPHPDPSNHKMSPLDPETNTDPDTKVQNDEKTCSRPLICILKICKMFLACWPPCRSPRLAWSSFSQH